VNIYSKRDGDADFILLARDTESPYIDTRARWKSPPNRKSANTKPCSSWATRKLVSSAMSWW